MPDREKVIKGLQNLREAIAFDYIHETDQAVETLDNALKLLKEQETVKPKSKVRHGANAQIQHFCGNCNTMLHGKPKFCSECGKAVKWE